MAHNGLYSARFGARLGVPTSIMNARARHFATVHHELANLIVEALASVIPFEQAEALVKAALVRAELQAIPERPEELLFFTSGPLYECAQRALDRAHADALLAALSPVLDRAWGPQVFIGTPCSKIQFFFMDKIFSFYSKT